MKLAYRPYPNSKVKWTDIKATTVTQAINEIKSDLSVYDCDSGGDDTYFVGLKTDERYVYYQIDHEWYWEDWFSDNRHVGNEFKFTPVTKEVAEIPDDRDWL